MDINTLKSYREILGRLTTRLSMAEVGSRVWFETQKEIVRVKREIDAHTDKLGLPRDNSKVEVMSETNLSEARAKENEINKRLAQAGMCAPQRDLAQEDYNRYQEIMKHREEKDVVVVSSNMREEYVIKQQPIVKQEVVKPFYVKSDDVLVKDYVSSIKTEVFPTIMDVQSRETREVSLTYNSRIDRIQGMSAVVKSFEVTNLSGIDDYLSTSNIPGVSSYLESGGKIYINRIVARLLVTNDIKDDICVMMDYSDQSWEKQGGPSYQEVLSKKNWVVPHHMSSFVLNRAFSGGKRICLPCKKSLYYNTKIVRRYGNENSEEVSVDYRVFIDYYLTVQGGLTDLGDEEYREIRRFMCLKLPGSSARVEYYHVAPSPSTLIIYEQSY